MLNVGHLPSTKMKQQRKTQYLFGHEWYEGYRPNVCRSISIPEVPSPLYRWRNCSWWSCVSWARYAKVPRTFMGLIVPCCWTISVLHGSIFYWIQAGRQKFCKIVPNQTLPAIWVSFAWKFLMSTQKRIWRISKGVNGNLEELNFVPFSLWINFRVLLTLLDGWCLDRNCVFIHPFVNHGCQLLHQPFTYLVATK